MADSCGIAELKETIEKVNTELIQSHINFSEPYAKVREQEECLSAAQTEMSNLREENVQAQTEMSNLREENAQVQTEMSNLREENAQAQTEMSNLREENAQTQTEMNNLREQNTQAQTEIINLREQNAQAQTEMNNLREQNTQAQTEIYNLREQNAQAQIEIINLREENAQSQTEMSILREQNAQFQTEMSNLREQNTQAQTEIINLQEQNAQSQTEMINLREENAQAQTEMSNLREQNAQSQAEMINLREQNAQAQTEMNNLREQNAQSQTEMNKLREQNTQAQTEIINLREQNAQAQTEMINLREENAQAQTEMSNLREQNAQSQTEIINLREQNDQAQTEMNNLREENAKAQTKMNNLREENAEAQTEMINLREQNTKAQAEMINLREENAQLASRLKESEDKSRAVQERLELAEQKLAQFSQKPNPAAEECLAQIEKKCWVVQEWLALAEKKLAQFSEKPVTAAEECLAQISFPFVEKDENSGVVKYDSNIKHLLKRKKPDEETKENNVKTIKLTSILKGGSEIKESSDAALNINSMPEDIFIKIFGYLSHNDLGRTAQVCTRWNALSRNPDLWKKVNVDFCQYRGSQNFVAECLINILPPRVTSLRLNFWNSDAWIDFLNFDEISVRLQERCPILEMLTLENAKISVNLPSIINLSTMLLQNLRRLALHSSIFPNCPTKEEEECGETCKIEALDLYGCYITHYNKPPLSNMPYLKKLYLSCTDVDDSWFEDEIYFLNQLHELDLRDTDVGSRTFQVLQIHAPNLRELYLCDTGVDLDEEDYLNFNISIFPHLKTICLRYNGVSCEGIISLLKACKSLQNVYVDNRVVYSYEEYFNYNECKLGIVKDDCCYYNKPRYFV